MADVAYSTLLRMITSGQLRPAQRLTEGFVCETLAMSRTPVREAMNRLAADGLISGAAHRSMTVRELTDREIIEMNYVREAFETQAARLAAVRITDAEVAELHAMCDAMDAITSTDEADYLFRCRDLDMAFHLRIIELSDVPALREFYTRHHVLQLHLFAQHWTRLPATALANSGQMPSMGDRHRPLVHALATRDPELADRTVRYLARRSIEHHQNAMRGHDA